MPVRPLINQIEVLNRLGEFDFATDELLEVVGAMVSARSSCTENHPSSAPGWYAWSEGARRLREIGLMKKDWERDETNGVPAIINRKLGIKIAVCNTDDGTCRDEKHRVPQNRTKKGPATDRIAEDNRQMTLPGFEVHSTVTPMTAPKDKAGIAVYYLCVYHEGDDVRSELSCPSETEAGYFSDFVERIFLVGAEDGDDGGVSRKKDDGGDGGEFDIPVTRKS